MKLDNRSVPTAAIEDVGKYRRQFLQHAAVGLLFGLSGCGGGESATATPSPPAPSPLPPPPPPPPPSIPSTQSVAFVRTPISTLSLVASSSGLLPYMATVYPLEGAVPAGQTLESADDTSLSGSVLSTWPDGSAQIVVVAGETRFEAAVARSVRLRPAPSQGGALTTANIQAAVNDVTVRCGSVGTASLNNSDLASGSTAHIRTWWANSQVICAAYRTSVGTHPSLEAIVYVHTFKSGRSFVEVVLENGRLNAAASSPLKPQVVNYGATDIVVNGVQIASVVAPTAGSTIGTINGTPATWSSTGHEPFRAVYASAWIHGPTISAEGGLADPGVEATHDVNSLQSHPALFRVDQPASVDLDAMYAADAYVPWNTGRYRMPGVGTGGDAQHIGLFPQWEAQYLQSGNRNARRAVIYNALKLLAVQINYRDSTSGLVPTFGQIGNKDKQHSNWPTQQTEPRWSTTGPDHHPQVGMMAFLCRPSPVFIELAQKACVYNLTWGNLGYGVYGGGIQVRAKAWCARDHGAALFLTPDGHPWKEPARSRLYDAIAGINSYGGWDTYRTGGKGALNFIWPESAVTFSSRTDCGPGFGFAMFEHYYFVQGVNFCAAAKVLRGPQQAALDTLADWAAACPVRYVNESVAGEFRVHYYAQEVGTSRTELNSVSTWGAQLASRATDTPPGVSGPMMTSGAPMGTSWATGVTQDGRAGAYYPSYFWAALCIAVERGVPGAEAAWSKFTGSVTNLSTWRSGFGANPRWGYFPRNK